MARPDLTRIEQEYQVSPDQMVAYHPRFRGVVDVPFTTARTITKTEAEMLDQLTMIGDWGALMRFKGHADFAYDESKQRYASQYSPNPELSAAENERRSRNDGHRDAYRHALWNAVMTSDYGPEWTKKFATAHEAAPANLPMREAMDLYNNEVGRDIAVKNPGASKEQLAALVKQAADNGELVVIDPQGRLAWSDQVSIGKHGWAEDFEIPDYVKKELQSRTLQTHSMSEQATDEALRNSSSLSDVKTLPLYRACDTAVDTLDAQMGRSSDQASACMKASLANLAATHGLERVDHVLLSQQAPGVSAGQNVFVVQGDPANPAHLRAHMPTDQAVKTPEDTSLKEFSLAMESRTAQQNNDLQQQQQQRDAHIRGA